VNLDEAMAEIEKGSAPEKKEKKGISLDEAMARVEGGSAPESEETPWYAYASEALRGPAMVYDSLATTAHEIVGEERDNDHAAYEAVTARKWKSDEELAEIAEKGDRAKTDTAIQEQTDPYTGAVVGIGKAASGLVKTFGMAASRMDKYGDDVADEFGRRYYGEGEDYGLAMRKGQELATKNLVEDGTEFANMMGKLLLESGEKFVDHPIKAMNDNPFEYVANLAPAVRVALPAAAGAKAAALASKGSRMQAGKIASAGVAEALRRNTITKVTKKVMKRSIEQAPEAFRAAALAHVEGTSWLGKLSVPLAAKAAKLNEAAAKAGDAGVTGAQWLVDRNVGVTTAVRTKLEKFRQKLDADIFRGKKEVEEIFKDFTPEQKIEYARHLESRTLDGAEDIRAELINDAAEIELLIASGVRPASRAAAAGSKASKVSSPSKTPVSEAMAKAVDDPIPKGTNFDRPPRPVKSSAGEPTGSYSVSRKAELASRKVDPALSKVDEPLPSKQEGPSSTLATDDTIPGAPRLKYGEDGPNISAWDKNELYLKSKFTEKELGDGPLAILDDVDTMGTKSSFRPPAKKVDKAHKEETRRQMSEEEAREFLARAKEEPAALDALRSEYFGKNDNKAQLLAASMRKKMVTFEVDGLPIESHKAMFVLHPKAKDVKVVISPDAPEFIQKAGKELEYGRKLFLDLADEMQNVNLGNGQSLLKMSTFRQNAPDYIPDVRLGKLKKKHRKAVERIMRKKGLISGELGKVAAMSDEQVFLSSMLPKAKGFDLGMGMRASLRKHATIEERMQAGALEIDKAMQIRQAAVRSVAAKFKLYEDILPHTLDAPAPGYVLIKKKNIPGFDVDEFGALGGRYIKRNDWVRLRAFQKTSDVYAAALRESVLGWKSAKVILGPSSHFMQLGDNTLAHILDNGSPSALLKGHFGVGRGSGKSGDKFYKAMQEDGIIQHADLREVGNTGGRTASELVKAGGGFDGAWASKVSGFARWLYSENRPAKFATKLWRHGDESSMHQFYERSIRRSAKQYKISVDKALTDPELRRIAHEHVLEHHFDYRDTPLLLDKLDTYGFLPFTRFAWKKTGQTINRFAKQPVKMSLAMKTEDAGYDVADEETKRRMRNQPRYRAAGSGPLTENYDYDFRRFMPSVPSQTLSLEKGSSFGKDKYSDVWTSKPGPISAVPLMIIDYDSHLRRPIVSPNQGRAMWLLKQYSPALAYHLLDKVIPVARSLDDKGMGKDIRGNEMSIWDALSKAAFGGFARNEVDKNEAKDAQAMESAIAALSAQFPRVEKAQGEDAASKWIEEETARILLQYTVGQTTTRD